MANGKVQATEDCEVEAGVVPASIKWRQPSNYVCISTSGYEADRVFADPDGKFALCDSRFYMDGFATAFDTTKDFYIDKFEFVAALASNKYCCGGSCPHGSWCEGLMYKVRETLMWGGCMYLSEARSRLYRSYLFSELF